jgi:hypothetical protein
MDLKDLDILNHVAEPIIIAAIGTVLTTIFPFLIKIKNKIDKIEDLVTTIVLALKDGQLSDQEKKVAKEKFDSLVNDDNAVL